MNDPLQVKVGDLVAAGILRNANINIGIVTDVKNQISEYYRYKVLWLTGATKNYVGNEDLTERDIRNCRALYLAYRKTLDF